MSSSTELPAGAPLGIIAGRGHFPLMLCRAARAAGVGHIGVVAMRGDAPAEIEALADRTDWLYPGQLNRAIRCFRRQAIAHVMCAGQIKPRRLFTGVRPDLRAMRLLLRLRERNAETIFSAVADELAADGLQVLPSTLFVERALAPVGVLGAVTPSDQNRRDIELGLRVARELSRLNIGQTVVVKRGTILALEAFEGTDKAIRRGGELGGGTVTVVKVAKANHDMRFDVPCIGMRTVEFLREARAEALAVQAGRTLLVDMDAVINACDAAGIAVLGVELRDVDR